MSLPRVLEPEVMDSDEEAHDYDAMDHRAVNARFCDDLLAHGPDLQGTLDVGTGTAQIPIALAARAPEAKVLGIDLAESMLELGRLNVTRALLDGRIDLLRADAKSIPHADEAFTCVVSNSIVHHIPEPAGALAEMLRVLRRGGLLFVRDLLRPEGDEGVAALSHAYAREETPRQRALFEASLRAALTLDEVRALVAPHGIPAEAVTQTSDRHWTLAFHKEAR